jgi:hypothetical protein
MIDTFGHHRKIDARNDHRRALQNPAVAHCQKTWDRVYRSALKQKDSKALALFDAGVAFREAMPMLVGDENIRDFIACVTYGVENYVLMEDTATRLYYAAQIAYNISASRSKKKETKTDSSEQSSQVPKP